MTGSTLGLAREFLSELLAMEREAGFSYHITSGKRLPKRNLIVGGVKGSAHTKEPGGKGTGVVAADIAATSSWKRYEIIRLAYKFFFRRIGDGNTFVHLDRDKTKPQRVLWHYYPMKKRKP